MSAPASTPTTPTFLMGVPWDQDRVRNIRELREQTGATVVWDEQHDAMDTWRRLMAAVGEGPAVCLEDDVQLADRWRARVEAAISEHPDDVIQFFSMRSADLTVGSRYEPGRTFSMNQCYYLPPHVAAELHGYAPTWIAEHPEHPTGYDLLMREWLRRTGRRYWVHVPSLVQHRPMRGTIDPRRGTGRRSQTFEEPTC